MVLYAYALFPHTSFDAKCTSPHWHWIPKSTATMNSHISNAWVAMSLLSFIVGIGWVSYTSYILANSKINTANIKNSVGPVLEQSGGTMVKNFYSINNDGPVAWVLLWSNWWIKAEVIHNTHSNTTTGLTPLTSKYRHIDIMQDITDKLLPKWVLEGRAWRQ